MNVAIVNSGVVVNMIVIQEPDVQAYRTSLPVGTTLIDPTPDGVGIGWGYDGNTFTAPVFIQPQ